MAQTKGGYAIAERCFEFSCFFNPDDCAEMAQMAKKEAEAHAMRLWEHAGRDPDDLKPLFQRRS